MKRTQIQLPDPLYAEIRRVARAKDVSVTELMRRGAEYIVRCYPPDAATAKTWQLPRPRALGSFGAPPDTWRELANER
jgi:hypothetical protein